MCLGTIGRIEATWDEGGVPMATVSTSGGSAATTCLLYVPDAAVGDTVLSHLGFVVERIEPSIAESALALRGLTFREE